MSRFGKGIRKGTNVAQGEVIGYVGSTGWSTGAHLHYEFRVANEAKDPMKIQVVQQAPLTTAELSRFRLAAADMTHRFKLLRPVGARLASR
jgi:murein DD-endopeptidase MepM/ murein hydrolase activator NlpD